MESHRRRFARPLVAISLMAAAPVLFMTAAGLAAPEPRTITVYVPFPPESGNGTVGRSVSEEVGRAQGVTIKLETPQSEGGTVGTEIVSHAAPDGNTVLITNTTFLINPQLKKLNYHPLTSFEPICELASTPAVLAVPADSPYHTFAEFMKAARAKPGELTIASVQGSPFHIGVEMLKRAAKVDITFLPQPNSLAALHAAESGGSSAMYTGYPTVAEPLKQGKLRALATGTRARTELLPDVPTIAESGYKGYEIDSWFGVVAPAKTPKDKIAELSRWFSAAAQTPDVKAKFAVQGMYPVGKCGGAFATLLHKEYDEFGTVLRQAKITAE